MKKSILLFVAHLWLSAFVFAQVDKVPVFISGTDGYKSFRIPAIIKLPNEDLLAFCEGRVNSSSDFGNIDIVMKRSSDQGKSWSPIVILANYDSLQAGNPAPVVDLTDPAYPQGKIFLFYNTGNNFEGEVRKGLGVREVWYITSTDNGLTWSEGVNITMQTHRPNQAKVNPLYHFKEDWRSYANTPGHALQISTGMYQGRIYVPANHSSGQPKNHFEEYNAHAFYSDDHGQTFKLSESVNVPGSNESTAAEISNNGILLNARNQQGDIKHRLIAISHNGGALWDTTYFDKNLPDPVCEGSILNIGVKNKKQVLAFSNAADAKNRNNLTLRISFDEGITWAKNIVVDCTSDPKLMTNNSAYSDLVLMNKNNIGILYEKDDYSKIVFTIVNWVKQ
ncbi:MAG: sialidase family protein [Chitinophagia bacterium]|jgi:sialidase-1